MVVKACAIALRANGAYRDGRRELYSRINVGIAVAARETLVVPTIFDTDKKGPAPDRDRVADWPRVRDASVTPPELSGGTFTVPTLVCTGSPRGDQRAAGGDPRRRADH